MSRGALRPKTSRRPRQINPNALHNERHHTDPAGRTASARSLNTSGKCSASCMIAVRDRNTAVPRRRHRGRKDRLESAVARVEAEAMEREAATAATVGVPSLSPDTEGVRADPRLASLRAPARETGLTDLLERAAHGGDDACVGEQQLAHPAGYRVRASQICDAAEDHAYPKELAVEHDCRLLRAALPFDK
jgi:hypothetical protein